MIECYEEIRWPIRFSLIFGVPPIAYTTISLLFGVLPLDYGPWSSVTAFPIQVFCDWVLGYTIHFVTSESPPRMVIGQHAILLFLNQLLWCVLAVVAWKCISRLPIWRKRNS